MIPEYEEQGFPKPRHQVPVPNRKPHVHLRTEYDVAPYYCNLPACSQVRKVVRSAWIEARVALDARAADCQVCVLLMDSVVFVLVASGRAI